MLREYAVVTRWLRRGSHSLVEGGIGRQSANAGNAERRIFVNV